MAEIKVVSKESHNTLEEIQSSTVSLSEDAVVILKLNPDDVLEIKREGNNAVVVLKSGEKITIVNFFKEGSNHSLVLEDSDHKLIWAQFTDQTGALLDEAVYGYIDEIEPLLYHDGISPLWALAPLATVAALKLLLDDDNDNKTKDSKDTTAPSAPTDVAVSADGTKVTGKGEPGTTVTVKDEEGNTIGTGTVNPDGTFEVELDEPLTNGEEVTVGLEDDAGNKSPEVTATAPDLTAPAAPTASFNAEGTAITGKTEPGAKVTVKDANGNVIGTATADSDG
ncbi:Ig-like domain-containing protein, partial [Acinetobacter puyangensis]